MAFVVADILARSLPAISGAANIAHMPKCERSSSADIPRPTSSMSGSFQCPGPAYCANGLSKSISPVNDAQVLVISNWIRHMFEFFTKSIPQLGGTHMALGPLP